MAYTTTWCVDKRVALLQIDGEVDLADLPEIAKSSRAYVAEGIAPVHILIDMRGVTKYPTNLREVANALKNEGNSQVGWTLFITNSLVLRFLGSTLVQLTKQRVHALSNVDEAIEFLLERDATLENESFAELTQLR